jgi:accessory gene regulator protein AgrB
VYGWLWRKLPGNTAGKVAGCLVLFVAVVAVLFFVVFPYVEPRLPFNNVTVNQ